LSRILVIEDSPSIALLLRRRIEMEGHEVEVRASGREALDLIMGGPLPDLVLADVMMPGMDGMETLGQIKQSHPGLPVILVTGQQMTRAETGQADALVSKPIDFEALFREISGLVPG